MLKWIIKPGRDQAETLPEHINCATRMCERSHLPSALHVVYPNRIEDVPPRAVDFPILCNPTSHELRTVHTSHPHIAYPLPSSPLPVLRTRSPIGVNYPSCVIPLTTQ